MIIVDKLNFSYGSVKVFQNICLSLKEGCIYGLLGENGVGKTTLLTILSGLKNVQEGSVAVDGFTPSDRKPSFLQNVYYLPDDVAPQNMSALRYAKMTGSFWPSFSMDRFISLLDEFEISLDANMSKMSTGQLKKTYIALALSLGVKYLFLDEPTNGLDIPSKAQFRKLVMKYSSDESVTVISTHQVRDMENVIDPIIILDRKDVLVNASLEEIASKFFFDYGSVKREDALYCEQIPGSFIQVVPNSDGQDSKVNIEAFFNAVHNHKEFVKDLMK